MPYIVDVNIPAEALLDLKKYDNVFFSANFLNIYRPVNTHPDLQIHFINSKCAFCLKECFEYYRNILPDFIEIKAIEEDTGGLYPENVMLNIAVFGKNVVCNTKFASKYVLSYYKSQNFRIINVNQGYAKCNIFIVSDNAVITEDCGIADKLLLYDDLDVCLLKPGCVKLENFEYVFLGGSGGIFTENTVGFYGALHKHKEFDKVQAFLNKHRVFYKELGDGGLSDFGSILKF